MESPLYETVDPDLKVIETLRFDPQDGFVRLDMHMARAGRTCRRLRFPFDPDVVFQHLDQLARQGTGGALRCRLTVDRSGRVEATASALATNPPVWNVALSPHRLRSNDPWLGHKTTRRAVYDAARSEMPDGLDEVILCNEFEAVCEGTITNVFLQSNDVLLTPALACGLLPGVLRQQLLESGQAREAHLTLQDLHDAPAVFVGNSLRGLISAQFN